MSTRTDLINLFTITILTENHYTEGTVDRHTDSDYGTPDVTFDQGDELMELSLQFENGEVSEDTVRSRVREILAAR